MLYEPSLPEASVSRRPSGVQTGNDVALSAGSRLEPIDFTHPTRAERGDDLVWAESRASHQGHAKRRNYRRCRRKSSGPEGGQVQRRDRLAGVIREYELAA
jgi:hypothetical protein